MDREPVKSASVASVNYDDFSETLEIEFRNGFVYHYYGVPEQTYVELMTASSIGRFINYKIKPYFPHKKVI
jgi:KTSC domain